MVCGMPRISEPTVAAHRAARERALLDAAHQILMETGEAPALGQVAARAGLARSSVYQYFDSRRGLLRAMVQDIYPRWVERIAAAMSEAPTPADRILAYAVENVRLVAEGAHAVGAALAALGPNQDVDEDAARMHGELQGPLVETLEFLGVESPEEVAALVYSVIHGATLLLEGHSTEEVTTLVERVLGPFVRELGGVGRI